MNDWNEEFDFDEPKPKNDKKGSKSNYNMNFADLEEENTFKLPSIGGRSKELQPNNYQQQKSKSSLEDIKEAKYKFKEYPEEEPELEFEESIAKSPPKINQPAVQPIKKQTNVEVYPEENYEEDNFEEQYEQEFEVLEEKKPTEIVTKENKTEPKQEKATIKAVGKPPVNHRGVGSVTKKDTARAQYSRNSGRSHDKSKSSRSKTRVEDSRVEAPNKYTTMAEKLCPEYTSKMLQDFSLDKLTRENERVRNAIKKLNDELNDLINKNINQLKTHKEEKEVSQEDIIRQLEEQKNTNDVSLQMYLKELSKLKSKEGTFREEEYHLSLDQKITETKNSIVDCGKAIKSLKFEVENDGKKLTKMDNVDKDQSTIEISNLKMSSINVQKEIEKNEEINNKLDEKLSELTKKVNDIEERHNKEMNEAKDKGINSIINPEIIKKAEELKRKIEQSKSHKGKTETLFKTKGEMVVYEIEQIKAQVKQVEANTYSCHSTCQEVQSQSKKVVEKARNNFRMQTDMISTLDSILAEMERGRTTSKDKIEDQSTFTHPKGAKKYHSQKNVQKINTPLTPNIKQAQKTQPADDLNLKKPQLLKKKKEEQNQDERVWKQETDLPQKQDKKRDFVPELAKFEDRGEKADEKKKPFIFKRNKGKSTEDKIDSPKIDEKIEKKEESNEEAPIVAPRMKLFKRKEESAKQEIKIAESIDKNYTSNREVRQQKEEDEKPSFVPKRFNLKIKDRKNEENEYVASTVAVKEQEIKLKVSKKKEDAIKSVYQQRTGRINAQQIQANQKQGIPQVDIEEEKPKLNLRERDRQKEPNRQQNEDKFIASKLEDDYVPKIPITLNDSVQPFKENSNPYAQIQQAPKREKEGRIKKQKVVPVAVKQQFNIYQQAENLTVIKDIEEPRKEAPTIRDEELDLKKMLGIDQKRKEEGFDDLLGQKPVVARRKKENDFFGDLQM